MKAEEIIELGKNKVDHERQVAVFGKDAANNVLNFWVLGYTHCTQSELSKAKEEIATLTRNWQVEIENSMSKGGEIQTYQSLLDDASKEVVKLTDELKAEREKNEWIDADENPPKEHKRYLCMRFNINCFIEEVCLYDFSRQEFYFNGISQVVSRYRELPTNH